MEQRFRRIHIRVRNMLQLKMRNSVVMQLAGEVSPGTGPLTLQGSQKPAKTEEDLWLLVLVPTSAQLGLQSCENKCPPPTGTVPELGDIYGGQIIWWSPAELLQTSQTVTEISISLPIDNLLCSALLVSLSYLCAQLMRAVKGPVLHTDSISRRKHLQNVGIPVEIPG